MEQILDSPIENQQQKLQYAGFWIRAAALIIDAILMVIIAGVVFTFAIATHLEDEDPTIIVVLIYLLLIMFQFLYFTIMESSDKQGTLGKIAVGIKIGDKNGNRISYMNAVGRFFSRILSGMFFYIGYMMAGWDDRKQSLHDKIANTFVYYSKN